MGISQNKDAIDIQLQQVSLRAGESGVVGVPPTDAVDLKGNSSSSMSVMVSVASKHINTSGRKFNEVNPGVGVSGSIGENTRAFALAYINSFYDPTLAAGVSYAPLKSQKGDFKADLGIMAGLAYSSNGSYAKEMPDTSKGKLSAIAGLYASIEHVPSGTAVEAIATPPFNNNVGAVGVSLRKRF